MRPIVIDRVARSVGLYRDTLRSSVQKRLNRDVVWFVRSDGPKESCVRWGSRFPVGRGNFCGKGSNIVKYRDFLP